MITERQEFILDKIIREHIKSAKPVSSGLIEEKYRLDAKPATIRRDFAELDQAGLTAQPYTSAGRVPTDKGYRLFVDRLFQKETRALGFIEKIAKELKKTQLEMADNVQFFSHVAKILSRASSNLAFIYMVHDFRATEGWVSVVKEPEFENSQTLKHFAMMVEELEERADKFMEDLIPDPETKVFIGKESRIPYCEDFSIVMTLGRFKKDHGFIALAGPKRMDYSRNLNLMRLAMEFLQKI